MPLTLDEAVNEIHRQFDEAIKSDRRAESCRVRAGQMLLALRERIEAGEAGEGVRWWQWYESKFVRSRRDAEKVMALARADDPEAAAEGERELNRQLQAKSRATSDVSRSNDSQSDDERDDPVDRALDLISRMSTKQRATLITKLQELGYV